MNRKYDEIKQVHNFVFGKDFSKNMTAIFSGEKVTDASFYVYIASKMDASLAPLNKDGLYIMLPVSNTADAKYEWDNETIADYRNYILTTLKTIDGFEMIDQEIVTEKCFTPLDFENKFNAYNGAVFGLLPSLMQSGSMRPQSKAKNCDNLYFTGNSIHPGAGVPIVLVSAKIAAQELMHDDRGDIFEY